MATPDAADAAISRYRDFFMKLRPLPAANYPCAAAGVGSGRTSGLVERAQLWRRGRQRKWRRRYNCRSAAATTAILPLLWRLGGGGCCVRVAGSRGAEPCHQNKVLTGARQTEILRGEISKKGRFHLQCRNHLPKPLLGFLGNVHRNSTGK